MLDYLGKQARNHLENDIFSFKAAFSLLFSFLFSWLRLLSLLLWRLLDYLIQSLGRNINIFDINVCGVFERINLADCCFNFIRKLMWAYALNDLKLMISQDNITLWIELEDKMICKGLAAEGHHNDTLDSHLPNRLDSLGAEMSSKTHSEAWRDALFVRFLFCEMKSHSVLYQQLIFLFRFGCFDNICGGVDIIDVGDSQPDQNLQLSYHCSDIEWSKTHFCFNFVCFISFWDLFLLHYKRLYNQH